MKQNIFVKICSHFFIADINLFASRINKQLPVYVTWFPDPDAFASDAFSFSWLIYFFPPFSMLNRICQKIEDDKVKKAILIVPFWPTQSWFPKLLEILIDFPVALPFCNDLLVLTHSQKFYPMNKRKLFLTACLVSGLTWQQKAFGMKLQDSWLILGGNPQTSSTISAGVNGVFGVVQNKLIPLHRL